jgi:sodium pump decarboxylase gamma subunit
LILPSFFVIIQHSKQGEKKEMLMQLTGQGLVLMLAGMGIVYLFLCTLIVVTKSACSFVARFSHILPDESPKKAPAKAAPSDDSAIALAIAIARSRG